MYTGRSWNTESTTSWCLAWDQRGACFQADIVKGVAVTACVPVPTRTPRTINYTIGCHLELVGVCEYNMIITCILRIYVYIYRYSITNWDSHNHWALYTTDLHIFLKTKSRIYQKARRFFKISSLVKEPLLAGGYQQSTSAIHQFDWIIWFIMWWLL